MQMIMKKNCINGCVPHRGTASSVELKQAYAKAYELTGSHEYLGGDQIPFSAAFSYLESAEYIDDYNFE